MTALSAVTDPVTDQPTSPATAVIPRARLDRTLFMVVIIGAVLRLLALGLITPDQARADDTGFYVQTGIKMLTRSMTFADQQPFPPLYALLTGGAVRVLSDSAGLMAVRLVQAAFGTAIIGFVWRLAARIGGRRAALIAALGVAINPIMIIDGGSLVSETLFLFCALWSLYIIVNPPEYNAPRMLAVGALFGLATLTRAALVAFPVGIILYIVLIARPRRAVLAAVMLFFAYGAVIGTWTLYNAVAFNRLVIGGYGINDLLLTATVGYSGSTAVDDQYREANGGTVPTGADRDALAGQIVADSIRADPVGYVTGRLRSVAEALLQPHQTPFFPGVSLKEALLTWARTDRSFTGLLILAQNPTVLPKAALYVFHFTMLIGTVIGTVVVLSTRKFKVAAPLLGYVGYFLLLHFFLLAIPRYLYPITPVGWALTGIALAHLTYRPETV